MRLSSWTPQRALALLLIATLWTATGIGVYVFLDSHRGNLAAQAQRPGQEQARNAALQRLPGMVYLVQAGTLYKLQAGTFTPLLKPAGTASWSMPAVSPRGDSLVVVHRDYAYSDLVLVDAAGHVQTQITHAASKTIELNHWALYPRLSADGSTLFFSYDPKDRFNNYNVVMAVWSLPLGAAATQMRKWTTPNNYTGGDVQPLPLASGGVIYTKYGLQESQNRIMGQLWISTRAGSVGRALTSADDDCSQPSLSPDGQRLAMICTGGKQAASLEVAAFDGTNIGPRQVVVAGQLAAQPVWSPSGDSIVYLAAQGLSGHFQLWLQQVPTPLPAPTAVPSPTPRPAAPPRGARVASPPATPSGTPATSAPTPTPLPAPVQLTSNLDFDATSTIAWHP
jgi:hypothetical protein